MVRLTLGLVQLIPRALVVGLFVPPALPGQQQVTRERLNQIWSDLAAAHDLTQLNLAQDGSGAQFSGRTPDDGMVIQPPLIQVRSGIETTAGQAAQQAQAMIAVALRNINVAQVFNLGVRHVYHAPLPDNDARGFVLRRLLRVDDDDLAQIESGSDATWGGVKYVVPLVDRQYTLALEPLQLDGMRSLFIDLDAQFPGEAMIDSINERATEAQEYLVGPVNRYLDRLAQPL